MPYEEEQWKRGYAAGFEAGKAALEDELKTLLKALKRKEPFNHTATYTITHTH